MSRNLRNVTPSVYGTLVLLGFLVNTRVGIAVCIVGAVLSSVVYTMARGAGAADATSRRASRQRNR